MQRAHPRASFGRRWLAVSLFGVCPVVAPASARAVDATVDFRDAHQNARTDTDTFETYWRRETLTVQQSLRMARPLVFNARLWAMRETAGGDATGVNTEARSRTYQPEGLLSYRVDRLQVALKGSWFERHAEGATALPPETDRLQLGGWLEAQPSATTRLRGSLTATHTTDEGVTTGPARDQRDWTGFARAEQSLGRDWQLDYALSGTSTDLTADDSHRTFLAHSLDLKGTREFGERVRTFLRARTLYQTQSFEVGAAGRAQVYRTPFFGGVALDDTPETLDPLEDDPISVPGLYDRDRETPTLINLGDSAPPVREFGGDYRNISFDFGELASLVSAFLYVDQRLLNPELYQWRVFVTDDPDGRLWEELGSDRATVRYSEIGAAVQGWEVSLADGVTGRFFKMVDVKLATTIPELFVTELEVFGNEGTPARDVSENAADHRLEASVDYDVTPAVRVGYATRVRLRRPEDDSANVDDVSHGVRSAWTSGLYVVSGRVDFHDVTARNARSTDLRTYRLAATRNEPERLRGTLSWDRADDRSSGRDQTTDTFALSTSWKAAPGLRLSQQVSHGRRHDAALDARATSYALTHRVEAIPWQTLSVEIDRADRWVDEDVGSGFSKFHETAFEAAWSPVPLVTATSELRYQQRKRTDWTTRETLTWSPFAEGTLRPTLSGDLFYDSRFDSWQPGARAGAIWRVRAGLLADGSVGIRRFEVEGVETRPVDMQVHVSWSP